MMNDEEKKILSIEMPLSEHTHVYIIFGGKKPGVKEFNNLDNIIKCLRRSIIGEEEIKTPPKNENPVMNKWKLRKLSPCEKHPESERASNNRCIDCLKEQGANMARKRKEKEAQVKLANALNRLVPPPLPIEPGFEYSVPMTCPICGGKNIRLRKSASADMFKDYWLHITPGQRPCEIKMFNYKDIKVDKPVIEDEELVGVQ